MCNFVLIPCQQFTKQPPCKSLPKLELCQGYVPIRFMVAIKNLMAAFNRPSSHIRGQRGSFYGVEIIAMSQSSAFK